MSMLKTPLLEIVDELKDRCNVVTKQIGEEEKSTKLTAHRFIEALRTAKLEGLDEIISRNEPTF